jgi:hypothetical protein
MHKHLMLFLLAEEITEFFFTVELEYCSDAFELL